MAVQGPPKEIQCPECFSINPPGSSFCENCGGTLAEKKGSHSEGSDTEVYQELARTNLLRMRGQHKEAVDACLGVLRRYPSNSTAHTLLGEIHEEQGNLDEALQWYEMAVDLGTASDHDKQKLADLRKKLQDKSKPAASKAQRRAHRDQKKMVMTVLGLAVILIVVAFIAYTVGTNISAENSDGGGGQTAIGAKPGTPSMAKTAGADAVPALAPDDTMVLSMLQTDDELGQRVMTVEVDPRYSLVTVTAMSASGETLQELAVALADHVFTINTSYRIVTVRLVQGNNLVLMADVDQQTLTQTRQSLAPQETLESRWSDILLRIWPDSMKPISAPNQASPGNQGF